MMSSEKTRATNNDYKANYNAEEANSAKTSKNLKALIDTRFCGANQSHCRPMQECPNEAIEIVADEKSGFGHRFVVNEEKCDGCGACIDICCGDCMELR